jgi:outer membrane receptor protein involved in Fe transport
MQLNATGFIYDYTGYQISAIVNRTSANFNVDAEISGIELETVWNPASTLLINANLGLLDAKVVDTFGVDILDRTNGRADLVVLKNFGNFSNCVVSATGYATVLGAIQAGVLDPGSTLGLCAGAFAGQEAAFGLDGVTVNYTDSLGQAQTATALQPFDGDAKNLDGNRLPGTPETTFNVGAEYTWEGVNDSSWDLRLRGDYYYQGDSFSRVWNTARDTLESWDNINLSVQMANMDNGVTVELFGKNLADKEVITGAYLTDDSSGLFTNVFLTEPQTYGVSIRKSW